MLGLAIGIFFILAASLALCVIVHSFSLVRIALRELQQEREAAIRQWSLTTSLRPQRMVARPIPGRTMSRPIQNRTGAARVLAEAVAELG